VSAVTEGATRGAEAGKSMDSIAGSTSDLFAWLGDFHYAAGVILFCIVIPAALVVGWWQGRAK